MASKWGAVPLNGINTTMCEVGKVGQLGCLPPIRFVPKVTPEEDRPKTVKLYIKTVGGMKEEITKFSGGEPEEALKHVLLFCQTERKMDILKDHTLLTKVKLSKESQLETITTTNDKAIQTKAKLRKEIVELKLDIKNKMDEYWSL